MNNLNQLRLLNAAADAVEWTWNAFALIDWTEVAATVRDCLVVMIALTFTAGWWSRRAAHRAQAWWCRWHANWVGSIDWAAPQPAALLADAPVVAPAPAAINPLFDLAVELEQLSANQLRKQLSTRARTSKGRMIAAALAC